MTDFAIMYPKKCRPSIRRIMNAVGAAPETAYAMMHADADNERANRTTVIVCVFALMFALTFVIAYTVRMNTFVALIKDLNAAIVELAGAKGFLTP